ncbi:MAG TPA: DUF4388 domain-containing protein [Planctomycetota bacterium]|jgi:tetratricopeptide (TPR) repeat protein|nr:DUF4388 domain-containing protein [Planctomycetota bacterium]
MALQGDLSTLDLTSLFQNLEAAQKTGLLSVLDGEDPTELFFDAGKLALIAWPGRIGLLEYVAESGAVAPHAIERAQKARRRGQTVGAALVAAGVLEEGELARIGTARLVDDTCEILAAGAKRFEFTESDKPSARFDREERALRIALPASPLLLESARRSDHWTQIREHLPSDSTHYVVAKQPRPSGDAARAQFIADLLQLADGTRTVREIVAGFPTRRFDAYQALSELAAKQVIRPITSTDLEKRVLEIARRDKGRALAMLERGLEENPRHLGLLCAKALLAERAGELEQASEALKLVVHLQLENAAHEDAHATLAKLRKLDEKDPFVWERSFELALEEGRKKDAFAHGRRLIELYAEPGLHRKVCSVLERMIEAFGESWELAREFAHARAAAGEREAAVKGLESYASAMIGAESYPQARRAYEEALAIAPGRKKTKDALEELKSGALVRRRARWKLRRRIALAALVLLGLVPWLAWEASAQRAFVEATRAALRDGDDLASSRRRFETVRARYAWTATARFDVAPLIADLEARERARAASRN